MTISTETAQRSLVLNWRRGPFAGYALTIHDRKMMVRWPADEETAFPCLLFIQGPRGVMLRAIGDDVSVNGVLADVHWLAEGDELSHARFAAQVGFDFHPSNQGPCALEPSSDRSFVGPEKDAMPSIPAPRPHRSWRRINRRLRQIQRNCQRLDQAMTTDISARIDALTSRLDSLASVWATPGGNRVCAAPRRESASTPAKKESWLTECEQTQDLSVSPGCSSDGSHAATPPVVDMVDDHALETNPTASEELDHRISISWTSHDKAAAAHEEPEEIGWTPRRPIANAPSRVTDAVASPSTAEPSASSNAPPCEQSFDLNQLRADLIAWKDAMMTLGKNESSDDNVSDEEQRHSPLDNIQADGNQQNAMPAGDEEDLAGIYEKATASLDHSPNAAPAKDQPQRPISYCQGEPSTIEAAAAESVNDDVATYMASFFSRLNLKIEGRQAPGLATPQTGTINESIELNETTATREVEDETEPSLAENEEYAPRYAAPERKINLETLRKLANQSTQSAIETFTEKTRMKVNLINAIAFAFALAISISLLCLSKQPGDWMFMAGITILFSSSAAAAWMMIQHRFCHWLSRWQTPLQLVGKPGKECSAETPESPISESNPQGDTNVASPTCRSHSPH